METLLYTNVYTIRIVGDMNNNSTECGCVSRYLPDKRGIYVYFHLAVRPNRKRDNALECVAEQMFTNFRLVCLSMGYRGSSFTIVSNSVNSFFLLFRIHKLRILSDVWTKSERN